MLDNLSGWLQVILGVIGISFQIKSGRQSSRGEITTETTTALRLGRWLKYRRTKKTKSRS